MAFSSGGLAAICGWKAGDLCSGVVEPEAALRARQKPAQEKAGSRGSACVLGSPGRTEPES